ncbi:MAG: cytochrome P450 [Anaerolineae bacterium]|nr:cytochrome P450 [Anaerolineae bacterium]
MPQQNEIPTIRGHWLTGVIKEFNADSLRFLEKATTYGDIVKLKFGPFNVHFINHPDLVHDVLVSQSSRFHKSVCS